MSESSLGFTLDELVSITGGTWAGDDARRETRIDAFTTDSRNVPPGSVFIALRGEKFDGHDFLAEVEQAGAAAAIVSHVWLESERTLQPSIPLIAVDEPLHAWGSIARAHRRRFDIPVVAVAGSNGKTTTKELVAAVLSKKFNVLRTEGNLNNQIGAPATLMRLRPEHDAAVIEIGTNMPGEIEILSSIVEPTHGLITNVGREHLELLKTLDGVAEEEGALFRFLAGRGGVLVVNADDARVLAQSSGGSRRVLYGFGTQFDVQGELRGVSGSGGSKLCVTTSDGASECELQLPGVHNAMNALAAAAVGVALGLDLSDIMDALREFQPLRGKSGYARLAPMRAKCGAFVLNDTYNSNPDSTRVAIATLKAMPVEDGGRRLVALGDMKELGVSSSDEHARLGTQLAEDGIDGGFFLGDEMKHAKESLERAGRPAQWFPNRQDMIAAINGELRAGDSLLIKGSRSMAMEEVVKALCD